VSDLNMLFVGDIYVQRPNPDSAFDPIRRYLDEADVAFCNLECVVADAKYLDPYDRDVRPRTDEANLDGYLRAGFNVMNLANNPSTWHGITPFMRCLDVLDKAGVVYGGGGRNLAEARKPAVIERNGTKVAFVCRTSVCYPEMAALPDQAGIAFYPVATYYEPRLRVHQIPGALPIVHTVPDRGEHRDALEKDVQTARGMADVVIVSWHWGVDPIHGGGGELVEYQTEMGHFAIDAGADMVLGHHPHTVQPIEVYKGHPIVYCIGSYVHDMGMGSGPGRENASMLVRCRVHDGKIESLSFVPGLSHGHGPPDYASPEVPDIIKHMQKTSARFGTKLEPGEDGVNVVL
jgi:poly-gamma-glutamate capsule biosynthesis protein CapA/YwtB (metallophosphatase superfamily)